MITHKFADRFREDINPNGRDILIDFFIIFSRFEFALKAYTYNKPNKDKAEADWDAFVNTISTRFDEKKNPELLNAVTYLLQNPPKTKRNVNGQLAWRHINLDSNSPLINTLCIYIRAIRNNLFHGGKFNGNFEPDVSRDTTLLQTALIVLNNWLELCPDVERKFSEFNI